MSMTMKLRSLILGLLLTLAAPLAASAQCSGQAPGSTYCGNPTGTLALPGWKPFSAIPLPNIGGGTVLGNRGTASAAASPLTNPILGIPGVSTGEVGLAGATSGTATLRAQAAAGAAIQLLPTGSGTLASAASTPLVLNAATGTLTCPTCGVTGSPLSQFAATTSAQLLGVISDETGTGLAVFNNAPTIISPVITTSFTATGLVGLGNLAAQNANTVLVNATSLSASPTAQAVPSCSTASSALQWVTNTGIQCGTITSAAASVTVGTTTVISGTTTRILYDNAGVLGEYTISGTGTAVAMANSPSLTTPALGVATGTSLALGGCTLGANALCATGTAAISSTLTSAAHTITSAAVSALAVGPNGATNPAFLADPSTVSSVTGIRVKSNILGGGAALSVITSGTNEGLSIDAAGSGTIALGGISTGPITLNRATTISAALTYGSVTLANAVTGTGNMVLSASPALTGAPTAPTAAVNTNTTQLATTQYVITQITASTAGVASLGGAAGVITLRGGNLPAQELTVPRYDAAQSLTAGEQNQIGTNIGAFRVIRIIPFTASGTYTPTAGMLYAVVEAVGTGGGGGGVSVTGAATYALIGGGGGGGGYARKVFTAAAVGASKAVVIGAAGAGGSGAVSGGAGGDATFGATLLIAKGGSGGGFASTGTAPAPGAGGTGSTGDIVGSGTSGQPGLYWNFATATTNQLNGGTGGSSAWGAGGQNLNTANTSFASGVAGVGYGAGGAGGQSNQQAGANLAGAGGNLGALFVTEYGAQ